MMFGWGVQIMAQITEPQGRLAAAFTLFDRGGPVMWPILAVSLMGLTVTFERLFAFWRYNTANFCFRRRQSKLIALTREGRFEEAVACARQTDSPVCRVLVKALENRDSGFQETLEAASQLELDRLRRGLSVLDTTITVAPMLGILGTVTGIINTFNMLNLEGIENPAAATAGIAEALITTAAGLIVAIACLFPFNFLVSQLKRRTHELEQIIHQFALAFNTGVRVAEKPGTGAGTGRCRNVTEE
ncbi:MAG TPA: MotA/TolQ/ExbB proton channel family protein [Kiritimatiellia bacterium]|nr:MotA/TolQ/ExbB proton channel family protein [Kiritimatiellia bacterium]HOR98779.1 MotA/TolQ/ExbB proton channel family protein [Kiritimatiellia bacterium]HPK37991.1 MotA/TolQ/ExbB proton channel family protein [Kiritimatiellia bacterium]HRU20433.1 MotA/TolQ/ExbB proton channel family protein [Kiritimatiellia bacterium]